MNIVITGGAGFLGARLARTLLAQNQVALAGAAPRSISRITLVDRAQPPADLLADSRVVPLMGDLNDLLVSGPDGAAAVPAGTDVVFHLAAAVSGECEADFDLGMRSNFEATHALLQACRALGSRPVVVYASSLAVFGNLPGQPPLATIDDDTLPTPQSSYGIQKYIGEQLVADFTRKGFIRGRSTRLMTVSVRAGRPNGAASGYLSGIVREPLTGERTVCPVPPDIVVALSSPGRTIEGIIRAAEVSDVQWGPPTAVNLPAFSTSVGDMVAALGRVAGKAATDLVDWKLDESILRLAKSWPGTIVSTRARALGLLPDMDFEAVIRDYIRENPDAIRPPLQP